MVFDATARLNNVYLARPAEFEIRRTMQARDYSTVTIYEARDRNTGKLAAQRNGPALAADTIAALLAHYGDRAAERRVLVVVAKDGEEHFREAGATAGLAAFDVAHWNKIDGRNDWRDYDTLCVATLPYATNSLDLNIYMAVKSRSGAAGPKARAANLTPMRAFVHCAVENVHEEAERLQEELQDGPHHPLPSSAPARFTLTRSCAPTFGGRWRPAGPLAERGHARSCR